MVYTTLLQNLKSPKIENILASKHFGQGMLSLCNLERMPSDWSITQLCSEILAY